MCLFFLHHAESEALVMMGGEWDRAVTFDPKALTVGASEKLPLAEVFRESRPALYDAGAAVPGWEKDDLRRLLNLHSVYYLPLSVEHRTIGVMAVGGAGARPFSSRAPALGRADRRAGGGDDRTLAPV